MSLWNTSTFRRPDEGVGTSGTGVTGSYVLPNMNSRY